MLVDLNLLINEIWGGLIEAHNLKLCSQCNEGESIALGPNYAILVWLDRDGLSFRYIDRSPQIGKDSIDLVSYLIEKRRWVLVGGALHSQDRHLVVRQGLINCAKTLEEVAPDILSGKKEWLNDSSVVRLPLTPLQQEQLVQAFTACVVMQ